MSALSKATAFTSVEADIVQRLDILLPPDISRVAVAVSGGADSLALLHLTLHYAAQRSNALHVSAVTVDHGLRAESANEAQKVRTWCEVLGVTHEILRWHPPQPLPGNLQEHARDARYALLSQWAREQSIHHMLIAHHADDQAETLLWHMVRGAGVDGLSAMPAVREDNGLYWIRPLLGMRKKTLEAYCEFRNQAWIHDPSNQNTAFTRVWLREWLHDFNEKFSTQGFSSQRLSRVAENMARAREALEFYTAQFFTHHVRHHANSLSWSLQAWGALPEEIRLRTLLHAQQILQPNTQRPRMDALRLLESKFLSPNTNALRTSLGHCQWEIKDNIVLVCQEPS